MKVLLVGIGRCGTNSLTDGFYKQGYHTIPEPFKIDDITYKSLPEEFHFAKWTTLKEKDFYSSTHKNLMVKTLVNQTPIEYHGKIDWQTFIIEFIKEFDKIIWLDRKNLDEHFLSIINLTYRANSNKDSKAWFKKWHIDDVPQSVIDEFKQHGVKEKLIYDKKILHDVIYKLGGNITWYEDLYGEDRDKSLEIIKSWDIPNLNCNKLNHHLHPSNRLRQFEKKIL